MMKNIYPFLIFATLILFSNSAYTQLAVWEFDGDLLSVTSTVPQASADDASSVGLSGLTNFFGCDGDAWSPQSWTTSATVNTSDDYAVYTITANAESSMAISSFDFTARRSNTGPSDYEVRSSDDSYATALLSGTISTTCSGKGGALPTTIFIQSGESVTFRIYGFDASGTGNMRMDNVTIGGTALPVNLTKFEVLKQNNNNIDLNWQTASEINNDRFEIERSSDANKYEMIGAVRGEGNSQKAIDYTFTDENPGSGINYYRLKQVDIDGTAAYSDVVSVKIDRKSEVQVTPTSTFDFVTVSTGVQSSIVVRSFNGQVMNMQSDLEGNFNIDMANYPQGVYFLTIDINGVLLTNKVVRL